MPNSFSIRKRGRKAEEGKEKEEIKEKEKKEESQDESEVALCGQVWRACAATFAVARSGAIIPGFTSHVNTAWAG
jgi:hypothetical protein